MSSTDPIAPPVVAVVIVHQPGSWFAETLDSIATQDYANLRTLFLVSGDSDPYATQIAERLPNAVVREVGGDPGFGATANEVLDIVEGTSGFFCFLHDDVVLMRSTIRGLVEELYRSNAGIVGPKLVDWDDRRILQSVGYGVDPYGEVDTFLEPGESDQEQHDAVRDVFALSSACLLVRADLFRTLGGFSPSIRFHGDDVELCWRAHLSGARTVVAPATRVRHRAALADRRPDIEHQRMSQRNRMFTVATLTSAGRLPLVLVRHVALTLGQFVIGLFTGTAGRALAALVSTFGLIPRLPAILARRRAVQPLRALPDSDVADQQLAGSARVATYLRARGAMPVDPEASVERRWRQTAGSAPAIAWIALVVALLVGSRQLITGRIPAFGEFLRFPSSPGQLFADFRSGWWSQGLGSGAAAPTGAGLIAVGSVLTLFHMGLWHTVSVLGLLLAGWFGVWRMCRLFPTARARITGVVVYAALPLPVALMASGRWTDLFAYAAMPWVVHLIRRCAGMETVGQTHVDIVEQYTDLPPRLRLRLFASLVLACAVPMAFQPAFGVVVLGVGVTLAVASLIAGVPWRRAAMMAAAALAAVVAAVVLHLPWSHTWFQAHGWLGITGPAEVRPSGLGLLRLARFDLGSTPLGTLAVALYLPLVVGLVVARSWRFTWAIRAASMVVVFLGLAVLTERGTFGFHMPDVALLLCPVAVGLALGAATLAAATQDDISAGGFGWRQPLAVLAGAAVLLGVVPGFVATGGGRWRMPRTTLISSLRQLPAADQRGDYRVLWLGNPRLIPVGSWEYQPGIAYGVSQDGPIGVEDLWAGTPSDAELQLGTAIDAIASETTLRAGRLLAAYGIRYLAIPVDDGSGGDTRQALAAGLVDALEDQLDLTKPLLGPVNYVLYENLAWSPVRAVLTSSIAAAIADDDLTDLAATDLTSATAFAVGSPDRGPATGKVAAGMLHVASPLGAEWSLRVGGTSVGPQPTVGDTRGFPIATAGTATLVHHTPLGRTIAVIGQILLWALVAVAATRADPVAWYRRRRGLAPAAPAAELALDDDDVELPPWQPGMRLDDVWGDE